MTERRRQDVARFLQEFKQVAASGSGPLLVGRRENTEGLADLGLTLKNCKEEIMGLSVTDYCKGPEPDRSGSGHVWVFGKWIGGQEACIKLKLASTGSKNIAKCISFHVAQYPLEYPLK